LEDWKRRNGLAPETRVFCITGAFPGVRKALVARGWHENEDKQSKCWDLKYALWQRDLGEMGELEEAQVVNYFARNAELTSKVGLCNSLYNCCTLDRVDVDSFFPRSYDLTSPAQAAQFVEDFKLTTCRCLLRRFVKLVEQRRVDKAYPHDVIHVALEVCRRQCQSVDDALDEAVVPAISEDEWNVIKDWSLKTPGKKLEAKTGSKATKSKAFVEGSKVSQVAEGSSPPDVEVDGPSDEEPDASPDEESRCDFDEALYAEALKLLEEFKHPQCGLDGCQNIWVLKPAGKSRGRGIQLSGRLEKIQEVALGRGAEARGCEGWMVDELQDD